MQGWEVVSGEGGRGKEKEKVERVKVVPFEEEGGKNS